MSIPPSVDAIKIGPPDSRSTTIPRYSSRAIFNPSSINSRGNAHYANKDYDQAIGDYSEVIRLDPKNVRALSNRGRAYYIKRDYGRATTDLTEAIRLDPNDPSLYTARANAYEATGEIDRADADFAHAKRLGN